MKYILITLLLLSCLFSQAQQQLRQFGIAEVFRGGDSIFIKKLKTVVIHVTDGMVTKQRTFADSARLFLSSDGSVYEGTMVWKKVGVVVTPPAGVVEKIDGSKATFKPLANWVQGTAAGWFGDIDKPNSIAYSGTVGATATYTFTGKRIELWAERLSSHGTGTVTVNGVVTPVSFNMLPFGLPVKIYDSGVLPVGTYELKLTVVTGICLLDYLQVHK